VLVNQEGKNYARQLPPDSYEPLLETIDQDVARQMIERTRTTLTKQVQYIENIAARE